MKTPAAIGDIGIRVRRNHFQHRKLGVPDLFHARCETREWNVSAPERVVLVTLPGRVVKINHREPLADTAQTFRTRFADEESVYHVYLISIDTVPLIFTHLL